MHLPGGCHVCPAREGSSPLCHRHRSQARETGVGPASASAYPYTLAERVARSGCYGVRHCTRYTLRVAVPNAMVDLPCGRPPFIQVKHLGRVEQALQHSHNANAVVAAAARVDKHKQRVVCGQAQYLTKGVVSTKGQARRQDKTRQDKTGPNWHHPIPPGTHPQLEPVHVGKV